MTKANKSSLLATKLQIPPQPQRLIQRSRLLESLDGGIPQHKLTLITTPAGYGKTTLLSQWADTNAVTVAWFSIDPEDNEPDRFLRYLVRGWERVQPAIGGSPLALLVDDSGLDRQAVLTAFINAAAGQRESIVFILDDYHLIENGSIHELLTFLLDHLPGALHFVAASRSEPPLPLARYRARRELFELSSPDLAFLQNETADFLTEVMGLSLGEDEIGLLQKQLEGWIAGLQLAALSYRQQPAALDLPAINGRHRFIADYLREDVLAQLSESRLEFLLQTSILDKLCASLCDTVTQGDDGQKMLEAVERDHLFLTPLDSRREWFRYHPLFADLLQVELSRRYAGEVSTFHSRAAAWYLAQDLPEQAYKQAAAAQNIELVSEILERYFPAKLMAGELKTLTGWIEGLPERWQTENPIILLAKAGVLLFTGQLQACAVCLDGVERLIVRGDPQKHLARVTAMRCGIACFQNDLPRAEVLADEALRGLPSADVSFQPIVYGALGDVYRQNGRWQEAKKSYLSLLGFLHSPAFQVQSAHIYGALADLVLRQGHLREAAAYWQQALEAIQKRENWGNFSLPVIGWVYLRMGELFYEWNELDKAWDHLSRGLERVELGGDVRGMMAGYIIAGRLMLTEGDIEGAFKYLEQARPLVENAQFPHWNNRFEGLQIDLWLAQERIRTAVLWVDEVQQKETPQEDEAYEIGLLNLVRVLLIKADEASIKRALALLDPLVGSAAAEGRLAIQIQALALQALAYWKSGYQPAALSALEQALRLAEPEGYIRLFADFGKSMGRLLQEARSRNVLPGYVASLLAAFGPEDRPVEAGVAELPDPLTRREQEALELLAAGLTNVELAEAMSISPETVKKHLSHLYSKLDVHDRRQAVSKARRLSLLT